MRVLRGMDSEWLPHSSEVVPEGRKSELTSMSFSDRDDASWLATGGEDGTVCIWDAAGGHSIHKFKGHISPVRLLAFLQDGTLVASGSEDGIVRVWDMREGESVAVLGPHDNEIKGANLLFSDDGAAISFHTSSKTTTWSIADGACHEVVHYGEDSQSKF